MKTIIIILFILFNLLAIANIIILNTTRRILREFGGHDPGIIRSFFYELKLLKQINKQENGKFRTYILIAIIVYSIDIIILVSFFLYSIFAPLF